MKSGLLLPVLLAVTLTGCDSDTPSGTLPACWVPGRGHWTASAPGGREIFRQDQAVPDWAVLLRDGEHAGGHRAQVRFRPISGKEDASGGLILLAQGPDDYYLCRANALEGNFRLYFVKGNRRVQLETVAVAPPALGTWHVLSLAVNGGVLRGSLDGRELLVHRMDSATEPAWTSGRAGLWTKADSVTEF